MSSIYDFVSVAAFGIMAGYFVFMTDRNPRLLQHFLLSGVAFAVSNQVGNYALRTEHAALHALAIVLVVAGVVYAGLSARR